MLILRYAEVGRYLVNGIVATVVHYGILSTLLVFFSMPSAGLANFIAAFFGILTSFFGSRYFVYNRHEMPIFSQAIRFYSMYGVFFLLHGVVLLIWTDILCHDYSVGFVIATCIQISLSYVGNKKFVFK